MTRRFTARISALNSRPNINLHVLPKTLGTVKYDLNLLLG
jgi:hypothetical protein